MRFAGSKIALVNAGSVVAYMRDDKPTIPFPGCWDLPGGGREGDETPRECVVREVQEELSILIDPGSIIWERTHSSITRPELVNYFFVAPIEIALLKTIVFGDEGQFWRMMTFSEFVGHSNGVSGLQAQLRHYLQWHG